MTLSKHLNYQSHLTYSATGILLYNIFKNNIKVLRYIFMYFPEVILSLHKLPLIVTGLQWQNGMDLDMKDRGRGRRNHHSGIMKGLKEHGATF